MQQKESSFPNEDLYGFRFIGDTPFAPYVFEFPLILADKPEGPLKIASDSRIPKTVIAILIDFFKEESKLVSLYIRDSSDFKQLLRKRKFDRWFPDYNNGDYIKSDQKLVNKDGIEFPVAIILRRNNPYRAGITDVFFELATHSNNEK